MGKNCLGDLPLLNFSVNLNCLKNKVKVIFKKKTNPKGPSSLALMPPAAQASPGQLLTLLWVLGNLGR